MSENRQIFSLKQVVGSIRKTIEERYQQTYWVKAEMHKLNLYPSGHAFPELVQKENDRIVAQISASIWNHNLQQINKQFITVVKEPLKEGTTLLMHVKIAFSEMYGLSLQILDIDPSYTLGELQKEREETLKKLQAERLINLNQQLDFPILPQRIAIVSADTSKGLSDFMKVLNNNPWDYDYFTMLFQAYLQGDMAVSSILEQLKRIEKVKHHFDCVVIVRGGGGEVGLSCYNNYELCKAIATFPLPVLTGIGHSTNMTVAEMVAFRNAITPTELADFLIQVFHEFSVPVNNASAIIKSRSKICLEQNEHHFKNEIRHFKNASARYLIDQKSSLQNASLKCSNEARRSILGSTENLSFTHKELAQSANRYLKNEALLIQDLCRLIPSKTKQMMDMKQIEISQLDNLVRLMDPINVLKRGYSITTFNEKSINMEHTPDVGDTIVTRTYGLIIESLIQKTEEHEK